MSLPFSSYIKEVADDMGISLFQRLSFDEASQFLNCSEAELQSLVTTKKIDYINMTETHIQFFGHQLVSYLLESSTGHTKQIIKATQPERIIRAKEVENMTGLSRTSIWRYEKKGQFPKRVPLGEISVGWKLGEVQAWIAQR